MKRPKCHDLFNGSVRRLKVLKAIDNEQRMQSFLRMT